MVAAKRAISGQLDLFEDHDAALAWVLKHGFKGPPIPALHASPAFQLGEVHDSFMCPDCGGLEWNDFNLQLNHGWSKCRLPDRPHPYCAWADDGVATCFLMMSERHHQLSTFPRPALWGWSPFKIYEPLFMPWRPGGLYVR